MVDEAPPNSRNDGHWLPPGQYPQPKPVKAHPLRISVFALISTWGKSKLHNYTKKMNGAFFTTVLKRALKEITEVPNDHRDFVLVMDSATIHTCRHTVAWLQAHNVKFIPKSEWPASSPDFNPIENLWSTLKAQVHRRSPRTRSGLKRVATKVWNAIPQDSVVKYVHALHKRYAHAIQLKGAQTAN